MSDEQQGADPFGQWWKLWQTSAEGWQRAVRGAVSTPTPQAAQFLDPMGTFKQWTEQWMQAAQQMPGMGAMGAAMPGGLGAATLGRMAPGAELFLNLGQLWLKAALDAAGKGPDAWKEALGGGAFQEMQSIWQAQLRKFAESAAMLPMGPAASTWLSGLMNVGSLGQTVASQLSAPWAEAARDLTVAWQQSLRGDHEAMRQFARTWKETYDKTYGKLLQAPTLGYGREPTERVMLSLDAYVDYLSRVQEFVGALDRAGRTAGQRWLTRVTELSTDGSIPSHRTIYRLYLSTFEESYAEVFQSREYSRLQARMVDSGLRFKRRLDGALEDLLGLLPVPTNSEMKELYQAFYELRKTVKQQQRRIAELERRLGNE